MSETMTLPKAGPRGGAWYILAWAVLGLAAAAYLAALTSSSQSLPTWLTRRALSDPQDNKGQRATVELAGAPAASLAGAGAGITAAELARLRDEVAEREAQVKSLQLRVAGLEQDLADARQRGAPVTANAGATTTTGGLPGEKPSGIEIVNASPVGIDGAPLAAAPAAVEPPLPVRRPPQPPAALRQSLGVPPSAAPIETGSIATAPGAATPAAAPSSVAATGVAATAAAAGKPPAVAAPFATVTIAAAEVKPASPPAVPQPGVGVRLTTGPSVDALRLNWSLLTERYGAELGGLEPRYVAGGSPSAPFALIAGPLADDATARSFCAGLNAKGLACVVDSFTGNAL